MQWVNWIGMQQALRSANFEQKWIAYDFNPPHVCCIHLVGVLLCLRADGDFAESGCSSLGFASDWEATLEYQHDADCRELAAANHI